MSGRAGSHRAIPYLELTVSTAGTGLRQRTLWLAACIWKVHWLPIREKVGGAKKGLHLGRRLNQVRGDREGRITLGHSA